MPSGRPAGAKESAGSKARKAAKKAMKAKKSELQASASAAAAKRDSSIPSTKAVPIVTAEEGDVLQEANVSVVPHEDWIMSSSVQSLEDEKLGLAAGAWVRCRGRCEGPADQAGECAEASQARRRHRLEELPPKPDGRDLI